MNICPNCNNEVKGKYCNNSCQAEYQTKLKIKKFKEGGFIGEKLLYSEGRWNRRLLISEKGYKCVECGIDKTYNGKHIMLEVNHIDGQAYNNCLENLEFLCPNCHSQTDTFRNKKRPGKSDRDYRRKKE